MKLINRLKKILDHYHDEIQYIIDFINEINSNVENRMKEIGKTSLKKEDFEELEKFIALVQDRRDEKTGKRYYLKNLDVYDKFILPISIKIRQKSFLAEMAFIYLISYQDAFFKDYLKELLVTKKNLLKTNQRSISYESICNFSSMKDLITHLAVTETEALSYGSIEDFEKYFDSKFNICFFNFNRWLEIIEANYRRNLIVHNSGKTNMKYCKKTGFGKKDVKLHTDLNYVINISTIISEFMLFIHTNVKDKFKL